MTSYVARSGQPLEVLAACSVGRRISAWRHGQPSNSWKPLLATASWSSKEVKKFLHLLLCFVSETMPGVVEGAVGKQIASCILTGICSGMPSCITKQLHALRCNLECHSIECQYNDRIPEREGACQGTC